MRNFFKLNTMKFAFVFACCVLAFALGINFSVTKSSNAAEISEDQGIVQAATTIKFMQYRLVGEQEHVESVSKTYTGKDFTLTADFYHSGSVTKITNEWYFSKENGDVSTFAKITDTERLVQGETSIKIKNHMESGYYFCKYIAGEDSKNSTVIQVSINQKELRVESVSPKDKVYDNSSKVFLDVALNPEYTIIDGESVKVKATAEVENADVGQKFIDGSLVSIDLYNGDEIIPEEEANYTISNKNSLNLENMSMHITPKKVEIKNWKNKNVIYDGNSHRKDINPYYEVVNTLNTYGVDKIYVMYKISEQPQPYSGTFPVENPEELKNSGIYKLELVSTEKDKNYSFVINDVVADRISFTIEKISPVVTCSKTNFTYTGEEQYIKNYISINNEEQVKSTWKFTASSFTDTKDEAVFNSSFKLEIPETANYSSYKICNDEKNLINPLKITLSRALPNPDFSNFNTTFTYSGSQKKESDFDLTKIKTKSGVGKSAIRINGTLKNAGNYIAGITISFEETENYKEESYNLPVTIKQKEIDVSQGAYSWAENQNFVFDGLAKSISLKPIYGGFVKYNIINGTKINAGTYVSTVEYYVAEEHRGNCKIVGSTKPLVWEIKPCEVEIPRIEGKIFTYNGKAQGPKIAQNNSQEIRNFIMEEIILMNDFSKINVGNYSAKFLLADEENYAWKKDDEGKAITSFDWKIEKAIVEVPKIKTTFSYDGKKHEVSLVEDSDIYSISCYKVSEVGTYEAKLTLNHPENYRWADENIKGSSISISWQITPQGQNQSLVVLAIALGTIAAVSLCVYLTLRFTVVKKYKQRHKKGNKKED